MYDKRQNVLNGSSTARNEAGLLLERCDLFADWLSIPHDSTRETL
jgi:hypothetical protein